MTPSGVLVLIETVNKDAKEVSRNLSLFVYLSPRVTKIHTYCKEVHGLCLTYGALHKLRDRF